MLDRFKGEIARALPKHLDGDRMARVALTCFNSSPRLRECEPRSVFASIIIASQLGLEPGVMGQCYLIPYKNSRTNRYECQLQVGYQGLVDLVRRSGLVKRIETHVVHANDVFEYSIGLENKLLHRPVLDGDPGAPRLAYAVAEFKDGGVHVEVMTAHEIFAIRDRSQNVISGKRFNKKTPWDTDLEEMMRKTVARRICKMLPKSASLATALAIDNAADRGTQAIDIDDAIDDTWAPPMDDEVAIAGNEPAIANAQADAGLMPRAKSDAADAQQAADAPAAAPRRRRRARKTDADERSSLEIMRDPSL
ncbi:MAG: recombinase RecT, partial [Burkholderiales bacterium]